MMPPIRVCRKPSVPSCCPIKKMLITIPTKMPMLFGKSNLINFIAVRIILNSSFLALFYMDYAFYLHIDQQPAILIEAYFEPPYAPVTDFTRFVVKDGFILKNRR